MVDRPHESLEVGVQIAAELRNGPPKLLWRREVRNVSPPKLRKIAARPPGSLLTTGCNASGGAESVEQVLGPRHGIILSRRYPLTLLGVPFSTSENRRNTLVERLREGAFRIEHEIRHVEVLLQWDFVVIIRGIFPSNFEQPLLDNVATNRCVGVPPQISTLSGEEIDKHSVGVSASFGAVYAGLRKLGSGVWILAIISGQPAQRT
mmetsp:Transcript_27595/g.78750  ORF Transcript_27595/g.78750 Transcript_27595/m.78750 type:complete len:206 (-) Transcript_27595:227-844(-)